MIEATKKEQRNQVRSRLCALGVEHQEAAGSQVANHLKTWLMNLRMPLRFALYVGVGHEIRTGAVDKLLKEFGHHRCYPRVDSQKMRFFEIPPAVNASEMQKGSFGIPEPPCSGWVEKSLENIDIILMPALLVSPLGHRLGQGGGFYDRLIASSCSLQTPPPFVALIMDEQIVEKIPHDPAWDQRIDGIISPKGCHWTRTEASFYRHPINNLLAPKP